MKNIKYILILIIFVSLSLASYSNELNYHEKPGGSIYFVGETTDSVADRANQNGGYTSGGIPSNPMTNGMLQGCYNMMQGATGGTYSSIEMQRQQTDYLKMQKDDVQPIEINEE